jgi:hypothetical protein
METGYWRELLDSAIIKQEEIRHLFIVDFLMELYSSPGPSGTVEKA